MPEATRADLFGETRPYLIGGFDKLTIDVFGIEELSDNKVQTDASGRIAFPLIGDVDVGNFPTLREIIAQSADRLVINTNRDVRDAQA